MAICECGATFASNDKDSCWELIVDHQLPYLFGSLGMDTP